MTKDELFARMDKLIDEIESIKEDFDVMLSPMKVGDKVVTFDGMYTGTIVEVFLKEKTVTVNVCGYKICFSSSNLRKV